MAKYGAGLLIVCLLAFIGYTQFSGSVLDEKASIEKGVQLAKQQKNLTDEEEALLRIQLALGAYMAVHSEAPESLEQLVPTFLQSVPVNPRTKNEFAYLKDGRQYKLGRQVERYVMQQRGDSPADSSAALIGTEPGSSAEEVFVNPNTMKVEEFIYDPSGKRDPFRPFDTAGPKSECDPSQPLTCWEVGQLRVTAVLKGSDGNTALVENEIGRGFTVRPGSRIGKRNGEVVSIESDRLKIVETYVEPFTNKKVREVVEMKIHSAEPRKGQ